MLRQPNLYLAAQTLADIQLQYARNGRTLAEAALAGAKNFIEWQHYPNNDSVDKVSGYEFYYHSHAFEEMLAGEHGHFHIIQRSDETFHHLIGIALNQKGLPVRLFTTNQWVTRESVLDARASFKLLKKFNMNIKGRMAPISQWLSALIKLFLPEIKRLLIEREHKILELAAKLGNRELALHSKKHHVLTQCKIELICRLSLYL